MVFHLQRHHQLIAKNVIASALWAHQDTSLPQVHSYANYNKILAQNYHQNNDSRVQGKSDTKDFDTVSIASSTRFTLVNGMGRFDESPKRRGIFRTFYKQTLCNRSHQISVLILTMSFIFLVGIIFAIYLLEGELIGFNLIRQLSNPDLFFNFPVRARDLVRTQQ